MIPSMKQKYTAVYNCVRVVSVNRHPIKLVMSPVSHAAIGARARLQQRALTERMCVYVCLLACVRTCLCACVRSFVRACVRLVVCVRSEKHHRTIQHAHPQHERQRKKKSALKRQKRVSAKKANEARRRTCQEIDRQTLRRPILPVLVDLRSLCYQPAQV
jgi:hypothetical protein